MIGGGAEARLPRRVGASIREHPDRLALAILVLGATVLFAIPAIRGSLVLPGDDLFQNYPLRVLSGDVLRSGRLPSWDPLIWSGTPLLAGWNAGAMFPGNWLFVLPAGFAWTVNLILAYAVCSTGTHLLLRRIGVGTVPAFLGALIFTYTGFMNGQIVHIGLIQGTTFTPWVLLGVELTIDAGTSRARAGAIALVGAAAALTVLSGDPRAPTSAAVIAIVWIAARFARGVARPLASLGLVVSGLVLGIALSAIQWIPGIGFLHSSQRANAAFSFFASGSLDIKTLATNVLVPYLIGTNGNFHLPIYVGSYNLPEVTIGTGLVGLSAAGAYLPALVRSILAWLTTRTSSGGRRLGTAYSLVLVGGLFTMGGNTFLARTILVHLPLFGGERLQNRNAVIFDLGFTLFVAFFVDDLVVRRTSEDGSAVPGTPRRRRAAPFGTWASVGPGSIGPLAAAALIAMALVDPLGLEHALHVSGVRPALFLGLRPYLIPAMVLALGLVAFAIAARYLPGRIRAVAAVMFVVIDVATYLLAIGITLVPTSALAATSPQSKAIAALAGPNGRTAIFNVAGESLGPDPYSAAKYGVTDLNLLDGLPSVQGYGSIVNSGYEDETNTHLFEDIATTSLDGPIFDQLNLHALLTPAAYLDVAIPGGTTPPIAIGNGKFTSGPNVSVPPPGAAGPYPISPAQPATFFLASPWHVRDVTFYLDTASGGPSKLDVTALGLDGAKAHHSTAVVDGRATVRIPSNLQVTEIDVTDPAGAPGEIGAVLVVTRFPGERLLLDGALQDQMTPPHWSWDGNLGPLTVFENHQAKGSAWLVPPAGRAATDGSVEDVSTSTSAPSVMDVDAPDGGTIVRSEEFAHGWTARLHPVGGGATIVLPVAQDGLIQKVTIPPGRYTVTWRYAPSGLLTGLVLTIIGTFVLLGLVAVSIRKQRGTWTPRREQRGSRPRPRPKTGAGHW